jgi:hypothetical protein
MEWMLEASRPEAGETAICFAVQPTKRRGLISRSEASAN